MLPVGDLIGLVTWISNGDMQGFEIALIRLGLNWELCEIGNLVKIIDAPINK